MEIKDRKFRRLMSKVGLSSIQLIKDKGSFYITSDNKKGWETISKHESYDNPSTFYLNSFKDITQKEWVNLIIQFFKRN